MATRRSMTTLSPKPKTNDAAENRRRLSDGGRLLSADADAAANAQNRRRVTIQALPTPATAALVTKKTLMDTDFNTATHETPSKLLSVKTPSKHRLNLGSASKYFFKDGLSVPHIALSTQKKTRENETLDHTDHNESIHSTASSMLWTSTAKSPGRSFLTTNSDDSSCAGELLNASVLSDPTELTASSYVRVVDSRQRQLRAVPSAFSFTQPSPNPQLASEEVKEEPHLPLPAPVRPPLGTLDGNDSYQTSSFPVTGIPKPNVNRRASSPLIYVATSLLQRGGSADRRTSMGDVSIDSAKGPIDREALLSMTAKMKNARLKREEENKRRLSAASENSEKFAARLSLSSRGNVAVAGRNSVGSGLVPFTPQDSIAASIASTPSFKASLQQASGSLLNRSINSSANQSSIDNLFEEMMGSDAGKTPNHRKSVSSTGDGAPTPSSVLTDLSPASADKEERSWSIDKDLLHEASHKKVNRNKNTSQLSDTNSVPFNEEDATYSQPSDAAATQSSAGKSSDLFLSPPSRASARNRKSPAVSPVVFTRSAARKARSLYSDGKPSDMSVEEEHRLSLNSPAVARQNAEATQSPATSLPRILGGAKDNFSVHELENSTEEKFETDALNGNAQKVNASDETALNGARENQALEERKSTTKRPYSVAARSDQDESHELLKTDSNYSEAVGGAEQPSSVSSNRFRKRRMSKGRRLSDSFSQVSPALSSTEQPAEIQEPNEKRRKRNGETPSPATKRSKSKRQSPKSPYSTSSPARRLKSPSKLLSPASIDSPAFNTRRAKKSKFAEQEGGERNSVQNERSTESVNHASASVSLVPISASRSPSIFDVAATNHSALSSGDGLLEASNDDETATFDQLVALLGEDQHSSTSRASGPDSRESATTADLAFLHTLVSSDVMEDIGRDDVTVSMQTTISSPSKASPARHFRSPAKRSSPASTDSPAFHTRRALKQANGSLSHIPGLIQAENDVVNATSTMSSSGLASLDAGREDSSDTASEGQLASILEVDEPPPAKSITSAITNAYVGRDSTSTVEFSVVQALLSSDNTDELVAKTDAALMSVSPLPPTPAPARIDVALASDDRGCNDTASESGVAAVLEVQASHSSKRRFSITRRSRKSMSYVEPADIHNLSSDGMDEPHFAVNNKNEISLRVQSHHLYANLPSSSTSLPLPRDSAFPMSVSSPAFNTRSGRKESLVHTGEVAQPLSSDKCGPSDQSFLRSAAMKTREPGDETASIDQIVAVMDNDNSLDLKLRRTSDAFSQCALSETIASPGNSIHLLSSSKEVISETRDLDLRRDCDDYKSETNCSTVTESGTLQSLQSYISSPATSNKQKETSPDDDMSLDSAEENFSLAAASTKVELPTNGGFADELPTNGGFADECRLSHLDSRPGVPASPMIRENHPPLKSILNSARKINESPVHPFQTELLQHKKSVAFGSPQAAEFNISSPPSSRLTPMPAKRAKLLYAMPSSLTCLSTSSSDSGQSTDGNSNTVEIEASLVDIPEIEEKSRSPGSDLRNRSTPGTTEPCLGEDLLYRSIHERALDVSSLDDETVRLETSMVGFSDVITHTTSEGRNPASFSAHAVDGDRVSPAISVEMSDANSIRTANFSAGQNEINSPDMIGGKRLEFNGEPTTELDGSLLSLVINAHIPYEATSNVFSPSHSKLSEPAKMKSSFVALSSRMSFGDGTVDDTESFNGLNDDVSNGNSAQEDRCGGRLDFSEASDDNHVLDITNIEVAKLAGIDESNKFPVAFDALAAFIGTVDDLRQSLMAESLSEITKEVCVLLTEQTPSNADWDSLFAMHARKNPDQLLAVQESVRNPRTRDVCDEFKLIASQSHLRVESEWESWSASLEEPLTRIIEAAAESLADAKSQMMVKSDLLEETEIAISTLQGMQLRRARRASLSRLKNVYSSLERELQALQLQLGDAKVAVEVAKDAVNRSNQCIRRCETHGPLKKDLDSFQTRAKSSGLRFVTLKGLHNWSLIRVESKMFAFSFSGCCPKTCFVTTFEVSETKNFRFASTTDKSWCIHNRRAREIQFDRQLSSFVEHKVKFILKSKGAGVISSISDMGQVLQQLEWDLSRLELVAVELAALRQYPGVQMSFERREQGAVSVCFELSSPGWGQRVHAIFVLDDAYPISPPHALTLDARGGNVDLNALDLVLRENVKPGFDLLSRLVKEIVAFLKA